MDTRCEQSKKLLGMAALVIGGSGIVVRKFLLVGNSEITQKYMDGVKATIEQANDTRTEVVPYNPNSSPTEVIPYNPSALAMAHVQKVDERLLVLKEKIEEGVSKAKGQYSPALIQLLRASPWNEFLSYVFIMPLGTYANPKVALASAVFYEMCNIKNIVNTALYKMGIYKFDSGQKSIPDQIFWSDVIPMIEAHGDKYPLLLDTIQNRYTEDDIQNRRMLLMTEYNQFVKQILNSEIIKNSDNIKYLEKVFAEWKDLKVDPPPGINQYSFFEFLNSKEKTIPRETLDFLANQVFINTEQLSVDQYIKCVYSNSGTEMQSMQILNSCNENTMEIESKFPTTNYFSTENFVTLFSIALTTAVSTSAAPAAGQLLAALTGKNACDKESRNEEGVDTETGNTYTD